ncbi:zinc ribbon domain-containing protein [Acetobacterium tundrae]|uniref:Transcriptional regulator n=1 Tax=Acetobacterium tundrae TaxID=132932 RepID=A0ABR6WJ24_9FIRM|nr:zinc ribbon domain-containing protein [Acetobacterium tundrae]MBC3796165.1 transcriptional regulator [Acetobacterium tundrae]
MSDQLCQSCGKPMGETDKLYGTEKNGEKSQDYCDDCYKNGEFTSNISMKRMIEVSIPFLIKEKPEIPTDEARVIMEAFFPTLKRWRTD